MSKMKALTDSSYEFEKLILRWILWGLFFSLLIGGTPWIFPENGKLWLDDLKKHKKLTYP